MIEIIKELNIEVSKPNVFQAIVAKQYDMNTRFVKATFVDDGEKIYIDHTADVKVVINALRPDGESKGFDGKINDDGTVTVPLHSWMLELVGTVTCDISVIDKKTNDNKKLTTTSFTLLVEKAAWGGDGMTNDPQYNLLIELLNKVDSADATADRALSKANRAIDLVDGWEADAESAREIVQTNETIIAEMNGRLDEAIAMRGGEGAGEYEIGYTDGYASVSGTIKTNGIAAEIAFTAVELREMTGDSRSCVSNYFIPAEFMPMSTINLISNSNDVDASIDPTDVDDNGMGRVVFTFVGNGVPDSVACTARYDLARPTLPELSDIRAGAGADGTVYATAGTAVREQIGGLDRRVGSLEKTVDGMNDIVGDLNADNAANIRAIADLQKAVEKSTATITATYNNGDVVTVSNVSDVVLHGKTETRQSKNLCSLRNAEVVTDNITGWKDFDIEEIPAGEYAISANIESTSSVQEFSVYFLDAEGNAVHSTRLSKELSSDDRFAAVYRNITAPFCKLRLYTANSSDWYNCINQTTTYTDIQIEAGQWNTPFEPYGDIVTGVPAEISLGDVTFSADAELYDGESISFANGLLNRSDGTAVSIECEGDVASLNGTYELSANGVVDIVVDAIARNRTEIDNLKQTAVLCTEQSLTEEQQAQARANIGAGTGEEITVDAELSDTSTNPVQNKVVTSEIDSVKENFVDGKKIGYSFGIADQNSTQLPYSFSVFGGWSIPIMKNSIMGDVCGIKLCLIFNASEMPVVLELYDQNKNLIKKLSEETVVAYPMTPARDGAYAVFHTFDCEFDKSVIDTDAAYLRVYIPNTTASSAERIRIGGIWDTPREEIDVNITPLCYTAVGNDSWKADVTVDGAGGYVNRPDNTFIQIIEKSLEVNPHTIKPAFDYRAYGLPVLEFNGNISMMTKDVAVKLSYKYGDREGSCTLKWQGSSSLTYPKKNYTVKFDQKFEAKEGWGEQKKYCLKANYIDFTHCRNVVSAKLWGQIVKSRGVADATLASCPNYGAVDGFPVVIVINDEFQGVYTFNIPKDPWMMNMGSGANECILCADNLTESPKFKAEATLDGDFEVEYITDEDDTAWALTSVNNLINACINTDGTDLDTTIAEMLDWDSAIDYWIFVALLRGGDMITKNYLLFTHDGTKWKFGAYDIDSTYGLHWDGTRFYAATDESVTFGACAGVHRVPELIKRYKKDALKARYKQLRNSVMSEDNVSLMFRNFAGIIPKPLLDEDNRKWPLIPNTNANSVQQIIDWYRLRCLRIDKEIESM